MFAQVIEGKVLDPQAVRAAMDRWQQDLAPGATGWLGTTAGISDDGQFIAVARFDSEAQARRNNDRPEQGQWWQDTSKFFDGAVTFHDSTDVDIDLHGDPNRAGFVQFIQGRSSDPDRARELMKQNPDMWAEFRSDVIGSVGAQHDSDRYTAVLYFTSEADARAAEGKDAPGELKGQMEEMGKLEVGEPTFIDIREPIFYSAG